ncbi:hypothetical protein BGZ99_006875, partial [Dissophora globulifera]
MSMDARTSSAMGMDQEQLDQRLSKFIVDHNAFRTLLFRYIRRALAFCTLYIDQEYPSFFRQFDSTDRLANLVGYIREYALSSYQNLDRPGTALLNQVDILLARGTGPVAAGSPIGGAMSPNRTVHVGSKSAMGMNGHSYDKMSGSREHLQDTNKYVGPNGAGSRIGFSNNRLLYLAGEVKEAIRFWREQCHYAQSLEPKTFELDRIAEMRNLALTGDGSTIEEKTRA